MSLAARLAFALALSAAAPATAAYEMQRLAIELSVARDEVPGFVCVVHENSGANHSVAMPSARPVAPDSFTLERLPDQSYMVKPPSERALPEGADVNERAFRALATDHMAGACSSDGCAARLGPGDPGDAAMRVTCAANAAGDAARVLVLRLRLPGDRVGEVYSVNLDGTVVSVTGRWGEEERPTAHVLGGHFFRGDAASARLDDRMQLRIQALCIRRDLALPPIVRRAPTAAGAEPWELVVDPKGGEFEALREVAPASCRRSLCGQGQRAGCISDSIAVMLSRRLTEHRVTAILRLPSRPGDAPSRTYDTKLEVRWSEEAIPNPLHLRTYGVRFDWRRRCELPTGQADAAEQFRSCPRADLIEVGVGCEPGRVLGSRCAYECNAPGGAAAFQLPLTVRFAAGEQEDAWREQLSHIDQTLSAFTPEATRQFSIDVPREARAARPSGDALQRLRIWTPSGIEYEFSVEDASKKWPVLAVPGGQCDSPLHYQYIGTRSFREEVTRIRNGRIVVPGPQQSALRWTWGALVAPALARTLPDDTVTRPPWNLALHVKLGTRYQPTSDFFVQGVTIEFATAFMLSRTPYYPLELPDSAVGPRARHADTWRIGAEIAIMKSLRPWLAFKDGWGFGLMLGAGYRLPAYARDDTALGGGQLYAATSLFVRARVGGPLWFELFGQYMLGENTSRFESEDLRSAPTRTRIDSHTFSIGLGPRVWL